MATPPMGAIENLNREIVERAGNALARATARPLPIARDIAARWNERHRYYHGPGHLLGLLRAIDEGSWNEADRDILRLAALFHDVVIFPDRTDSEEQSAQYFLACCDEPGGALARRVTDIILDTRWTAAPGTELSQAFRMLDAGIVFRGSLRELWEYETGIFREYQYVPLDVYRQERLRFLESWRERHTEHVQNIDKAIDVAGAFVPRVAVYAGSFNPFHVGHLAVLRRAERMFDKVILAVGINPTKTRGNTEAFQTLKRTLRFHQVDYFEGLLTEHIAAVARTSARPPVLIRGIRDGDDLGKEMTQFRFLQDLEEKIDVVFVPCDRELAHVSSTGVRELGVFHNEMMRNYIPTEEMVYGIMPPVPPARD